jgi:hypothetical protein
MTGVTIGTVHMNWRTPGTVLDEFGIDWGLTQIDGWFDGWEGSSSVDQRSQADGAWVSPQYAGPRIVHVAGDMRGPSWDAITRGWDGLLAQLPFRQLATMRVDLSDGGVVEQTALVRQHEKPILSDRFRGRANFSLSLLAPDPRKYDASSRSASLVLPLLSGGIAPPLTPPFTITGSTSLSQTSLSNDGNTTTYPILMVAGPCPPAVIANLTTGEAMRVVDAVPAGQTLVIDVLAGTATVGGQSRRVLGSWWGLVPGVNEVAFSASGYDAAAGLSISYRSAWK